jgi:hypothetical protein
MSTTQRDGQSQEIQTSQENQGKDTIALPIKEFSSDVTEKCIKVTESFRSGSITNVMAILRLQEIIPHDTENHASYIQALGAYMRVLDNFE